MVSIAIIGAGLCGLTVANKLKPYASVTVFEKARGIAGRMSTRRAEPFCFDHGAQFFTAKTDAFQSFISPMIDQGVIQRWDARFVEFEGKKLINSHVWDKSYPHYVGVPGMNAIAKYLAQDLNIQLNTRITTLQNNGHWNLINEQGHHVGTFDWVVFTIPAPQLMEFIPRSFIHYPDIDSKKMLACFSLMLGFDKSLPLDFDAALVRGADISWISVSSSKPGRKGAFSLLIHSSNKWAEDHFNDDREKVMDYLCQEASRIIGYDLDIAKHKAIHGWRYANIQKQENQKILIDTEKKLAVGGDWCIKGRIEAAFTSGLDVANYILKIIN